jgi:hypothetical protein
MTKMKKKYFVKLGIAFIAHKLYPIKRWRMR